MDTAIRVASYLVLAATFGVGGFVSGRLSKPVERHAELDVTQASLEPREAEPRNRYEQAYDRVRSDHVEKLEFYAKRCKDIADSRAAKWDLNTCMFVAEAVQVRIRAQVALPESVVEQHFPAAWIPENPNIKQ